jgi:preprotein translocase subunit SecG
MESLVILVHVLAAIGITGLVLIQHGKGADMGASFGSGASATIFGSVGSGNALTKSTAWLATVFFITSLVLALFAKQQSGQAIENDGLIENTEVLNEVPAAAAVDVPTAESVASDVPQTPAAEPASAAEAVQAAADATDAATAAAPEVESAAAEVTTEQVETTTDTTEEPAEAPPAQ